MPVPTVDFRFMGIGAQVGCLTLAIVLGAVFGGIWLDRLLGTRPVLTLIFVLGSAPFSLVLTYYIAIRQVRRMQSGPTPGASIAKEDELTGKK
jgi:ABC-type transport system involved in cytochrome c biogenesis permease subunit